MTLAPEPPFEREVFPAELAEIARRRHMLHLPPPAPTTGPSVDHDLLGLALSGGGIRSASLSLGVLQALAAKGVLAKVDYLSTVSGGGLVGSAVTSVLISPETSPEEATFPLGFDGGEAERPAVRYIRNNSRYLAPGGLLSEIRLPAVILRGMISNLAVLLPWLLVAVLLTELLYVLAFTVGPDRIQVLPRWIALAFVVFALLLPVLYRLLPRQFDWTMRNRLELALGASLLLVFVALIFILASRLVQRAIDVNWTSVTNLMATYQLELWIAVGVFLAVMAGAGRAAQSPKPLKSLIGLLILGLTGPGLVFGLYLALTAYEVESPRLDLAPTRALAAQKSEQLQRDLNSGIVSPALREAFLEKGFMLEGDERIDPPRRRGTGESQYTQWVIEKPGHEPHWWCTVWDCDTKYFVTLWQHELRLINAVMWGYDDLALLLLTAAGLAYGWLFCNQNITSQHGFFRDRLSRCFVFSLEKNGAVTPADMLKLSDLNPAGSSAPYHLINGTVNLGGATNLELAGRKADFFMFSRHFVGGPTTGYCRTSSLEAYDRNLNLATAMSISGAGLAPNAGTQTVPATVFLTTLLNLRLDYWLPNPAMVRAGLRSLRMRGGVGPFYLLKEAMGAMNAAGAFVNVSDGGHLENLGLCELLRRRCRRVIVVDATEDPAMTFACLAAAIRYARIDLGIEIAIDLDPLRLRGDLSTRHWAKGDIDYGRGETGQLIFLKSSLTGDEAAAILEYKRESPTFPQESSSNQFFSESQFEAYRALGAKPSAAGWGIGAGQRWP